MSDIDTSTEAVERLIKDVEMLARVSARVCDDSDVADEAVVMLRALLAERNRMRKALETIRDMVVDGVSFNTIARAALGEERA